MTRNKGYKNASSEDLSRELGRRMAAETILRIREIGPDVLELVKIARLVKEGKPMKYV